MTLSAIRLAYRNIIAFFFINEIANKIQPVFISDFHSNLQQTKHKKPKKQIIKTEPAKDSGQFIYLYPL